MPATAQSEYICAEAELICAAKINVFPITITAQSRPWITGFLSPKQ
jgi:hypothetical protein